MMFTELGCDRIEQPCQQSMVHQSMSVVKDCLIILQNKDHNVRRSVAMLLDILRRVPIHYTH